jgi:hypothetical protein
MESDGPTHSKRWQSLDIASLASSELLAERAANCSLNIDGYSERWTDRTLAEGP